MKNGGYIRELLGKYLEGSTTLEEERTLKEFFRDYEGGELDYARSMFAFFREEGAVSAPGSPGIFTRPRRRLASWSIAAAACIAVAVTAGIFLTHPTAESYAYINGVKVTDPQIVLAEYEKAMAHVKLPSLDTKSGILAKTDRILGKLDMSQKVQKPLDKLEIILSKTGINDTLKQ